MNTSHLICIIDDDSDYRFILHQLFKLYFPAYQVSLFDSGEAFLNEIPQLMPKPSLILLDRHMPGLDGYQTLLHLKQHDAHRMIPVVMMSAHASELEIYNCYKAYANAFVMKQIDFVSIKETLSTICHYWLEFNQEPVEGAQPMLS